jgi:4a-hydroxytetrahydrobiopterin dehydratase
MNLNELLEKAGDEVAIMFGRFNPPHVGHRDAWVEAAKSPVWYIGTNKATVGLDDPLPYDVKIEAMKTIMPSIAGHIVAEQGWWTLATYVYEKHGPVTLYIVTDEKDAKTFVPGIQSQNGKEGKHGYYNFKSIEWRKAERISSATDLRNAVLTNNKADFTKAAGVDADTKVMGKSFFDLVAEYLLPYSDQIQARAERKAKKQAKTAEESISEAPIEMDPSDPMDPMIHSHDKANPAKLKYRMLRAAGQLKDLASRAENASPSEWQTMARQFEELKMNMEQIRHALEELGKMRKKGGIRSRGIDPMLDSMDETIGKVKGGYRLYSKDGKKNLGTYPTKAGAEKRERQVQYFKHAEEGVEEGKFRKVDIEEKLIPNDKLNDLKSKYLPDWEMLDHRIIQAKYVAKDHRHAEDFVSFINKVSEKLDHFAEVTQDVAEVTVKTTTFDVKGLTILDFKLALKVDKYAESNEIEQVRMQGNFGMHESSYGRYYCSTDKKWKTRKGPKQKRS